MFFTKELAAAYQKNAGQPYCPGNGTEGELMFESFCYRCAKEKDCDIPGMTMICDISDPEYPEEWQIGRDGQPTCTAFEKRRPRKSTRRKQKPRAAAEMPKETGTSYRRYQQVDLF